jgi:hypothetical protein
MANQPRLLKHCLSFRKNNKVRDSTNIKPCRQRRMRFGIHLEHDSFSRHILRCASDLRRSRPARSAPRSPEIHQHWNRSVLHDLVEKRRVSSKWLGDRLKWLLARAAPAGTGQMVSGHAILLFAMGTRTNDWHINLTLLGELDAQSAQISSSIGPIPPPSSHQPTPQL